MELRQPERKIRADEVHLVAAVRQRASSSVATMPLPPIEA
jgi:hypothetical protein